jgi:hypothetical protein
VIIAVRLHVAHSDGKKSRVPRAAITDRVRSPTHPPSARMVAVLPFLLRSSFVFTDAGPSYEYWADLAFFDLVFRKRTLAVIAVPAQEKATRSNASGFRTV